MDNDERIAILERELSASRREVAEITKEKDSALDALLLIKGVVFPDNEPSLFKQLEATTEQLQAAETQITYDTECIERITKAGMQAELDRDAAERRARALSVLRHDANHKLQDAESRARAAESALAKAASIWPYLRNVYTSDHIDCGCFECQMDKSMSGVGGAGLLNELEKAKKDLQEMTANYLLATSPTKPI